MPTLYFGLVRLTPGRLFVCAGVHAVENLKASSCAICFRLLIECDIADGLSDGCRAVWVANCCWIRHWMRATGRTAAACWQ